MAPIAPITPPALNHLVIFNPSLKPPKPEVTQEDGERDRDLEDDLAQAAQILFYTSHAERDVSRDVMLRQVGLVKGLMSFTDMVAPGDDPGYWSVHSQRARMVVYSPEQDFFIYANVALSTIPPDPVKGGKGEPSANAQGLSDQMLIDCLRRGYDDFKLLHGPLPHLLSSPNLTATLDRFWTRFALQLESTVLTPHPDPLGLTTWFGGYPSSSADIELATTRAVDVFREDTALGDTHIGIVGKDGPISLPSANMALKRYLVNLVRASLPQEPIRQKELHIPGGQEDQARKSSWTGWVPTMAGLPGLSRSGTPTGRGHHVEPRAGGTKAGKASRWHGLGLGGLGESLGSVGQAFSLGGSRAGSGVAPVERRSAESLADPVDDTAAPSGPKHLKRTSISSVVQTAVSLPDLEAAQAEPELELVWDEKMVWIKEGEEYEERCLRWIIRDSFLLYIMLGSDSVSQPSTSSTLSLFSKLSSIFSTEDEAQSRPSSLANSAIFSDGISTTLTGPGLDPASALSLAELKHFLECDSGVSEVFARTAASRFVAAKQDEDGETYMLVGKRDASLVDADHAIKAFERARQTA
ncbi:uncharacterized protein MKK02DRAFT_29311 [Dioszegia hungarica]|uniref:CCZ1/INTU/HSP4 first Longin domain-containing protein n=1 Tax=Dioszegia hungarica TaxID=4972 RepID=A0AA38HEQ4_9TREE|nr:uncharacterized protein MKK02DRAFT_29311 [Dioszegia hungarica]KAI9639205.1 hypothetical protein MKK02DRAFT_29311 [Dioszegia hungarica]